MSSLFAMVCLKFCRRSETELLPAFLPNLDWVGHRCRQRASMPRGEPESRMLSLHHWQSLAQGQVATCCQLTKHRADFKGKLRTLNPKPPQKGDPYCHMVIGQPRTSLLQPKFALRAEQGIDIAFVCYFSCKDDVDVAKHNFMSARIIWEPRPGAARDIERRGVAMPFPTIRAAFLKLIQQAQEINEIYEISEAQ